MKYITGLGKTDTMELSEILLPETNGKSILVTGMIHSIRDMGEIKFIILRKREGVFQTVLENPPQMLQKKAESLRVGQAIKAEGIVRSEMRAPHGIAGCT